jgi:predicted nucleic acid-binding protein
MEPLLADTSVWIDFFRGKKTWQCKILINYIEFNEPLVLCPIIIQEILQGIRNDDTYDKIKENLFSFEIFSIDPIESALGAAELYRMLRKKGTTIRKSNDCLIAYYAIHYKIKLLHKDIDFEKIAFNSSLKTVKLQS